MLSSSRAEFFEEFAIVVGLITVQVIFAIYGVFVSHLLAIGLSSLFLITYGSLAAAIILSPFAIFFERSKWPREFSSMLLIQVILIALGGVAFQGLMLLGIKDTSPAIASAMPNLAPGFIFIIAWCLRFEKVDLKCTYSRAKILGTLVCLTGALAMSFLQGPPSAHVVTTPEPLAASNLAQEAIDKTRLMGCMYLLAAVFVISCTVVLQAAAMGDFPAPLSLCAVSSLIGSILTGILQLIQQGNLDAGSEFMSAGSLVAYAIMGGTVGGLCTAFQMWSVKKRGPVLVSMFSPIGTVTSAILSAFTLGEAFTIGRIAGMFLMFSGLYFVLWAKKKEGYIVIEDDEILQIHDTEKPLLS
ncbi:nodulin MtN21 /EamA-like transporter family protein [Tasmannia lanceolata]|uniref:nodulin MtN21 /EamA-like transporter family protein n=1 Tax=Tasmannia lanceolata TaxID=3420 RepID=UPI004063A784